MSKKLRQQAIVDIVSLGPVYNQSALGDLLREKGYEVTQATLSRDIASLGLVKGKRGYTLPPGESKPVPGDDAPLSILSGLVTKVEDAVNLVVLSTSPGAASAAARTLDELEHERIVGTVAGDDTVLIVTRSTRDARDLRDEILQMIG